MSYSTEETKDALTFVLRLGEGFANALEDGKLSFADFIHFAGAFQSVPAALSGAYSIPKELSDLTEDEARELIDWAKEEFDIPQDGIEEIVERGFELLFVLYQFLQRWLKK